MPFNGTVNFRGERALKDFNATTVPQGNRLLEAATMGVGSVHTESAVNSTEAAVRALWLSLSVWLQDFNPGNGSQSDRPRGHELELWTVSYGGHYAAAFYDFTTSQNLALDRGVSTLPRAPRIRFLSIGLANACVDSLVQLPSYPEMAFNNTYGQQLVNETMYLAAKEAWGGPEGCQARIRSCREAAAGGASSSPRDLGNNATVNALCHEANTFCGNHMVTLISASGRSFFDIGHPSGLLTSPTLHTHLAFLKRADVQAELGVPVNFTDNSLSIYRAFSRTGDNVKGDYVASLGRALDDGVRVSLMYGDRDYACNCKKCPFIALGVGRYGVADDTNIDLQIGLGGEALSLAIQHKHAQAFKSAGYEPVHFPGGGSNSKGKTPRARVRQHGNLSFTRVFDSSHTIGTEWPSVAFTIFNRTVSGVDIASGTVSLIGDDDNSSEQYSTVGPQSVRDIINEVPADADEEEGMCYTLAPSLCSRRQLEAYLKGRGRVRDYWLVDYGDGSCSPNPVEPCQAENRLKGCREGIIGTVPGYAVYIVLVVISVVVVVWSYARSKPLAVKYKYRPLRSRSTTEDAI